MDTNAEQPQRISLEMQVIRKDGTVEDLGTVAEGGAAVGYLRRLFNKARGIGEITVQEETD